MHQVKGEKMKNSLILPIILMGLLLSQNAVAVNQNKHVIKHTHINHDHFKNVKTHKPLTGIASWYGYESVKGNRFHLPITANGDIFNPHKLTAAHKKLPFGTKVKVTNLKNNHSVVVVINDRGPFIKGRLIDLSKHAARIIGITGTEKVSLTILSDA